MSQKKIRRRTKPLGSRRLITYLIVIVIVLSADYLYRNFIDKSGEPTLIEQIVSDYNPTQSNAILTNEATKSEENISSDKPTKSATSSSSTERGTYRTGWAELPASQKSDDLLYAHHTLSNGRRNYSVCYSKTNHCPLWVAAALHKSYKGDVKRMGSYNFDPRLPINHQISLKRSYGEYTRGHMLGSSDRTISEEANLQTFYVTNIAPQIQDGFNSSNGAWNNLERFVEKQVCADTLYVVIGALFETYTDVDGMKIEAESTTNRNDKKQVAVPTAYYQALLRTKSGRSGRNVMDCRREELKCAAFIVGHRSAAGRKPSEREMISIKELEKLTGVEFFANVKNAPKAHANAEDWGL